MKKETKTVLTTVVLTVLLFIVVGVLLLIRYRPAEFVYQRF